MNSKARMMEQRERHINELTHKLIDAADKALGVFSFRPEVRTEIHKKFREILEEEVG